LYLYTQRRQDKIQSIWAAWDNEEPAKASEGVETLALVLAPGTVMPGLGPVEVIALGVPAFLLAWETAAEAAWSGI
jgi:hypothetical protein